MGGTEFEREKEATEDSKRGIVPEYFANPDDPVIGTRDPRYGAYDFPQDPRPMAPGRQAEIDEAVGNMTRIPVRVSDLRDYYLGLSVEEQKTFAQVLFARDHMDKADIVSIEDIYDPNNVANAMANAASDAAFNIKMGTQVYDEGIPTLEEGFKDFTQEEFNTAVQEFVSGNVGAAIDPVLVEELFKSTYGSETGEVASTEIQAFMKGVYANNKNLGLQELGARARRSIRENPQNEKLVQLMDRAKAVSRVQSLISQL
jgi:ribosomal protein L21E